MINKDYDVAVLGSGPGGYVSAIRLGQLGLKTVIIEKESIGGICLNWGCIPTKALLHTAEIMRNVKNASRYGVECSPPTVNWSDIIARSRKISDHLASGVQHLMDTNGIKIIKGHGRFTNNNSIEVINGHEKQTISAKNIIIATGATARFLPGLSPSDSTIIHGYREALTMKRQPENLLVIGSGAIGIEFASFFNEMGTKVTILETANKIMPHEDDDISLHMEQSLIDQGLNIYTSAKIEQFILSSTQAEFKFYDKNAKILKRSFDSVISAVGVNANIHDIGLENTDVQTVDNKYIGTSQYCRTNREGIYAIGDIASPPWLAHKASREAVICAETIAGQQQTLSLKNTNIPSCIYAHPQIASVGLTEKQAVEKYGKESLNIGKFPFLANGKALALGDSSGFVKTIYYKITGELLGAHLIGHEVTEIISSLLVCKSLEGTDEDILNTIFPHPTLSESVHESTLNAIGRGLHF
jgi:dihydrolipoamide dehydrogenase